MLLDGKGGRGMRGRRNEGTLFFGIAAVYYMATGFAHPVTPALIKRLALEDYMFGLALAMMMLSNFLFSPFWGKISGYLSSRRVMLFGCVGYGAGQVLFVLAQNRFQFLFARFFAGIFVGASFVGILTYLVNTAPDAGTRGRRLITSATLQAVFGSLGYFVGGMLGEIHAYVAVAAQAAVLALCGVLFYIFCQEDAAPKKRDLTLAQLAKEANPFRAFAQGRQFMTATLALLLAVCALQNFSQTAFDQSFNYYVIDQIGLSTGYNGLIKAVMGMVTLVANSTLCAWLMRKTDVRKTVGYVLLACTLCIASVLRIRALAPFLVMNVLFYALSAISIPMTQSLVAASGSEGDSNLVMGFYSALRSFGGIIGALLAGFAYTVTPLTPFVCCAVGLGIATGCAALYRRRTSREA